MSKPKYDYYGYIKMRIQKYPALKKENTIMALMQWNAIEHELASVREENSDKYKAIQMVLIKRTHTINGAAYVLNYSYATVKLWISEFVKAVARRSGF